MSSLPSSPASGASEWNETLRALVPPLERMEHVRYCSPFCAGQLDRHPRWAEDIDAFRAPAAGDLEALITEHGLDAGLRRFRNHLMLRIIWRDLCGLASLGETFACLTGMADVCTQAAVDHHTLGLQEKHGRPMGTEDGAGNAGEQRLVVIGMGKLGGGELNLSSDIDVIFVYPQGGECDGPRGLSNEQFFLRLARAVIASLADVTEDGFCFRVDTRLRPFGDAGPLCSSMAALEQYYQREGRDWERYALIKARPIAGDLAAGARLLQELRPFIYRRYIDFGAVEALQDMHASVQEDARRKDRLDDVKRGPGGIREIEFLAQCFQLLRGGREPGLQTPSLKTALDEITLLDLLPDTTAVEIHRDYAFLRTLENRIQAMRDQQTHRVPAGEDLDRLVQAMDAGSADALAAALAATRESVSQRFSAIFPSQPAEAADKQWGDAWRQVQLDRQSESTDLDVTRRDPMSAFLHRLDRISLSQRAHRRLDGFMPMLLERIDSKPLDAQVLNRVFDLVLSVCRRSAYLILLTQHPQALDSLLELFARSEWVAAKVIRFPALLDELIDPSLGRQIPAADELQHSVKRLISSAQSGEAVLEGLNYLKLATSLRIAVAQLQHALGGEEARAALSKLAEAVLQGVLLLATDEIESRHGRLAGDGDEPDGRLAIIAYGTLGADELGYDSDLDIIFLFEETPGLSDGKRPLPAERYFARLAQRILSFLTVTTPSGRLYPVDTRLRPNGRAGSLVSSIAAFRRYQLDQAWTWELQALTRARFVAGSRQAGSSFETVRREVLTRPRDFLQLQQEMADMRQKISASGDGEETGAGETSPKYQPGGLIDIEFIVQLGVLFTANRDPAVLDKAGTLQQLSTLRDCAWIGAGETAVLEETARALRQQRLMATLVPGESKEPVDTGPAAEIYHRVFESPAELP